MSKASSSPFELPHGLSPRMALKEGVSSQGDLHCNLRKAEAFFISDVRANRNLLDEYRFIVTDSTF